MKPESIIYLNQIKRIALNRGDINTVEWVNGVLYEEGHITEIMDYPKWLQDVEGVKTE